MSDKTALGDRMKQYEQATRTVLPRRTHTVVRVDGKAFHSFLRHADKPFDDLVIAAMNDVGAALCNQISGSVFSYTQSDECSVLITDFSAPGTQPWFGGGIQKIASVAASIATVAFNRAYSEHGYDELAMFDARAFTIPDPVEVANYFLWRQRDCVRNSVTMAAQAKFSHKQLHGVGTGQMQELLWSEHGINWNAYPDGCKRGRVTVRQTGERDLFYLDKRSGNVVETTTVRSWWETQAAPHFTVAPDGWLAQTIPSMPTLGRIVDKPAEESS